MEIRSKIYASETVTNTNPRPNADAAYIVAYVEYNGESFPALFTDFELKKAMRRAKNNPEDLPPEFVPAPAVETTPERKGWFASIFGGE